jgi:hypothetical protein
MKETPTMNRKGMRENVHAISTFYDVLNRETI